jgi:hypothetical protein
MDRNGWARWAGISGRDGPEYPVLHLKCYKLFRQRTIWVPLVRIWFQRTELLKYAFPKKHARAYDLETATFGRRSARLEQIGIDDGVGL